MNLPLNVKDHTALLPPPSFLFQMSFGDNSASVIKRNLNYKNKVRI